jgi:sulfur carrier protein
MKVRLNGEPLEVPGGTTVREVLAVAGLGDERGLAVAVDGEVVPRSEWVRRPVTDGQQVEVLRAVQGGSV